MTPATIPPTGRARRDHVREHLLVFGDLAIWAIVAETVASLHDEAAQFAIQHVAFIGVGVDSDGWTASAKMLDREGRSRERMILLGPATSRELVIHELSHAMRSSLEPQACAIPCAGEVGYLEHLESIGRGDWARQQTAAEEARAAADVEAWR